MRPIVDGLQAEYTDHIAFVSLNARDDATGEAAFEQLGLSGHPAVVLFQVGGDEAYRGIGVISEAVLRAAITDVQTPTDD